MLICTQPSVTSVRHHIPKDTICPFLCIPSTPPWFSHSFRSFSEVTFPCHQSSLPYPCPFSSVTLVTLPVSPIFLGVNFLIYKWPWTLPFSQLWSSNKLQLHLNLLWHCHYGVCICSNKYSLFFNQAAAWADAIKHHILHKICLLVKLLKYMLTMVLLLQWTQRTVYFYV